MKVEELRLLFKEVVQETMSEELSSILTEAVKIASTPSQLQVDQSAGRKSLNLTEPDWVKDLAASKTVSETRQPKPVTAKDPLKILAETAREMSLEDFNNFK